MKKKLTALLGKKPLLILLIAAVLISVSAVALFMSSRETGQLNLADFDSTYILTHKRAEGAAPELNNMLGNGFRMGAGVLTGTPNPCATTSDGDSMLLELILEPLMRLDRQGVPENILAEDMEISEDGRVYTFALKEGVTFSDGSPLTPQDIKASFLNLKNHSATYDRRFSAIEDIQGIDNPETAGIHILSEKSIAFHFNTPAPSNLWLFTLGIQRETNIDGLNRYYREQQGSLKDVLKGTGPYVLASSNLDSRFVPLTANKNYHGKAPAISELTLVSTDSSTISMMLSGGFLDTATFAYDADTLKRLEALTYTNISSIPGIRSEVLGINHHHPALGEKSVRQALEFALDRESIIKELYKGYATVNPSPFYEAAWATPPDLKPRAHDVEKAKKMLKKAGWQPGDDGVLQKDGLRMSFMLVTYDLPHAAAVLDAVQKQWREIGVEVEIVQMPFNQLTAAVYSGNFDMYFWAWQETVEPDVRIRFGKPDSGVNPDGWYDNELGELVESSENEFDLIKRQKLFHEIARRYHDDAAQIPIATARSFLVNLSRVQDVKASAFISGYWRPERASLN